MLHLNLGNSSHVVERHVPGIKTPAQFVHDLRSENLIAGVLKDCQSGKLVGVLILGQNEPQPVIGTVALKTVLFSKAEPTVGDVGILMEGTDEDGDEIAILFSKNSIVSMGSDSNEVRGLHRAEINLHGRPEYQFSIPPVMN